MRSERVWWIIAVYDVLFFTRFELEMCNTWLSKTIMLLLAFAIVCEKNKTLRGVASAGPCLHESFALGFILLFHPTAATLLNIITKQQCSMHAGRAFLLCYFEFFTKLMNELRASSGISWIFVTGTYS